MGTSDDAIWFCGKVVLPDRILLDGAVAVRQGRISKILTESEMGSNPDSTIVHSGDGYIAPGFVDIHTHGGAGFDYMDGTVESIIRANQAHAQHGTTTLLPTTTSGTTQQLRDMLDSVQQVQSTWSLHNGARVGGVHWYGPYFAPDKIGAHPKGFERHPDPEEYLPALERRVIRSATCAAELPGAVLFCKAASSAGCLVTCGHSNASWLEMDAVYQAGMRHVDHFWNAMSSTDSIRKRLGTPQHGSMAEFVLYHQDVSTEVIADGFHHAPEMLQFAYRMIGSRRLCLVSDCNRAFHAPPGIYRIGHRDTGEFFENNGKIAVLPGTDKLAGSIFPMEHMVRVMMRDTDAGLAEVIRMATLTPAQRVGLDSDRGSIEPGKLADIIVLSPELHTLRTFIGGQEFTN